MKTPISQEQISKLFGHAQEAAAVITDRTAGFAAERAGMLTRFPTLALEAAIREAYVQGVLDGIEIANDKTPAGDNHLDSVALLAKAEEQAKNEAASMYPEGERRQAMQERLTRHYFAQFTTPPRA